MSKMINNQMVPVTEDTVEPPPGSVILRYGKKGTAYQRHARDGRWHSATGTRSTGIVWSGIVWAAAKGEPIFVIYHCEEGA
jgi:hypothetical protein